MYQFNFKNAVRTLTICLGLFVSTKISNKDVEQKMSLLPVPRLAAPVTNPWKSNSDQLWIAGGCENGATVVLSGHATDSVLCTESTFSFVVSKSEDGTYFFSIQQKDAAGLLSKPAFASWIRDTAHMPAKLVLNESRNSR